MRLDFYRELMSKIEFEGVDLEARTLLFVAFVTWKYATFSEHSKTRENRSPKHRLWLQTQK